jgi:hypothetical protein
MKARDWPLAAFVICGLVLSSSASAYTVMTAQDTGTELKWTSLPMKFNIHQAVPPGISSTAYLNAIRAAYKTWSDVSCSYYAASDQGTVNLPWGDHNDFVNSNVFTSGWPSNYSQQALGITWTQYYSNSGKITDADTHYNPSYQWDTTGSPYKVDVQAVATHEIGHQLGLDHSQYQDATMFYATGQGDTSQRSLHSDDIAGICYLYPTGQPPPPECTSPAHCAPNETCQNGKCVLANQKGYGSSCTSQKDCTSGICLQYGANTFCSQMCSSTSSCPNGDQCLPLKDGGSACLPGSANMGTKLLGEPCLTNMDCKTQICVSVPGQGYLCAQECDLQSNDCPQGFMCAPTTSGGGLCIPDSQSPPPPPPPTKKDFGAPCTQHSECKSNVCYKTCTQWCAPEQAGGCPSGYECKSVAGTDKGVCVATEAPPPPTKGALGDSCNEHDDCQSGICADSGGMKFCTELCDPSQGCAEGFDCISAGPDTHACNPANGGETGDDDGGCGIGPASPSDSTATRWMLLIFLLPLFLLARRD